MLELGAIGLATLVLAAISDEEEGTGKTEDGPFVGSVSVTQISMHWTRSLYPRDHLIAAHEEQINAEIRRRQALLVDHAREIQELRDRRSSLK